MSKSVAGLIIGISLVFLACTGSGPATETANREIARSETDSVANLKNTIKTVDPFFEPMGEPKPGDWLAAYRETGQTFEEYLTSDPTLPIAGRRTIYIMPIGKFTQQQSRVIKAASEYIESFYGLPVKSLPSRKVGAAIAENDYRMVDYPQHRQVRTGYILHSILQPALPGDAAALIAFTDEDLYPDTSMYFVFGQASLENRVGVWSLFRLDDLADYDKFMRRTLKISVHEMGHMFGMRHCTKYRCVMSGTNHLEETDSRPIDACPECMAKVCWFTKTEPSARYKRLYDYCVRNRMKTEADEFRKKMDAVSKNRSFPE